MQNPEIECKGKVYGRVRIISVSAKKASRQMQIWVGELSKYRRWMMFEEDLRLHVPSKNRCIYPWAVMTASRPATTLRYYLRRLATFYVIDFTFGKF